MKRIILFICVFFFIYPVFPKGFPMPLDRVLQILGLGIFVLSRTILNKLIPDKNFIRFIFVTLTLFALAVVAQWQSRAGFDTYFIKITLDPIFFIFSSVLIYFLAKIAYKEVSLGLVIYYIVLAAIVQSIVSFVFFLNKDLFNVYMGLLNENVNKGIAIRATLLEKRFIGVGNQFFTGSINYGIAFFSVLILPYIYKCRFTQNKILYGIGLGLITLGGLLTGRTFFVAIALGILMITLFKSRNIIFFIGNNFKILLIILFSIPILWGFVSLFIDAERLNTIFDFVFVLFINYFSGNGVQSHSTDQLLTMYIFPAELKTWLLGDGQMLNPDGSYYMHTDVGYLRLIYYFGIPGALYTMVTLYCYSRLAMKRPRTKAITYYMTTLFTWLIILNFKGLAFQVNYFVLFIVFTILSFSKKKNNLSYSGE